MKTKLSVIVLGCLLAAGQLSAQVSISAGNTYTENFDALGTASATWGDNSTLPGWYASVTNSDGTVASYTTAYTASAGGSGTSTTLYSFGASGSSERALGGTPVTTRYGMLGWRLVNGSGSAITNLVVTYDGEQWRRDVAVNTTISVSYKIFAPGTGGLNSLGGWTAAPASLTFTAPTSGAVGAISGNDAANRAAGLTAAFPDITLQPNDEIWFKWTSVKVGGPNIQVGIDNVTVSVPLGTPPVVGEIPNITVVATQTSVTNAFTVNDAEDDAAATPLPTPTASSSNEAVVPSANVFFGGSGSNRTVYVVAVAATGSADITVSITDSDGNIGKQTFTVTVLPLDFAPVISTPPPTNTLVNMAVTVPFTVSDVETPVTSLVVTGQVAAYSLNILSNLTFSGSGAERSVTVEPMPGADGVGVVSLSVTDSNNATVTVSFAVMVRPAANVVFIEHFDYAPTVKLFDYSAGLWVRRNSSAQTVNLMTAPSDLAGYIRPKTGSDDGAARLAGAPYRPGEGALLYTKFTATWVDLGAGDVLVTNSNSAFVHLANNSSATSTLFGKVATTTNNVPDGSFRLALYDLNDQYQANSTVDIPEPNPASGPYTVVMRYDVDSAKSLLWVNATTEADPSASSQDHTTPENISYIGLRQDLGCGYIYVDDLKVVLALKPTITSISQPAGGNVDIDFSTGPGDAPSNFGVVRANTVTGTYNDVSATITSTGDNTFKATVAAPGNLGFYRIKRLPLTF